MKGKGIQFWFLMSVSALLVVFYLVGQTTALFSYEFALKLGMQESVEEVTEVGIAYAKGFAFADTVFYIPLFIIAIIGLYKEKPWGLYAMLGSMAVTIYWPLVSLYAIFIGRNDFNLSQDKYIAYTVVLSLIVVFALWALRYLYLNRGSLVKKTE